MKVRYKIGIWGQFGDGGKIADGQAVRTTVITEELKNRYGSENLYIVNTNNWKKHPFSFLWNTLKMNAICRKNVIFPADNGFKVCVPILNFSNKLFRRELYYVVIGGFLPELLRKKDKYIKMLKKYRALFVQTPNLKKDLEEFGLNNIYILSNLKRLNTVRAEELSINENPDVKVCVMCRITESKGIAYAVESVRMANATLGENRIKLDFFGMIDSKYSVQFEKILSENKSFISYGGVVDFDKTTETLRNYFLMLFPTYYYGEGFPGNVVDAYNAALPIVATDWNYNKEVISDGVNGLLVSIKDAEAMKEAILRFYYDREYAYEVARNNLTAAEQYKPDVVLKTFYEFME